MSGSNSPISSVGVRLEMYRLAIEKIEDVPLFGHGYRTSNVVVFKDSQSEAGQLSYTYNHLHNAYLTNYFNGGIVLLGALLLLLFVPLLIFLKANKKNCENPIYISGVLLTLGYSSFGMVNILLGDTYMNGFYVFFLAIFLLLTNKSIKLPVT
jgi:O-antigen ligase